MDIDITDELAICGIPTVFHMTGNEYTLYVVVDEDFILELGWQGCSNIRMVHEDIHLCGLERFEWFREALRYAWDLADRYLLED